jgi:hypothetical protein
MQSIISTDQPNRVLVSHADCGVTLYLAVTANLELLSKECRQLLAKAVA